MADDPNVVVKSDRFAKPKEVDAVGPPLEITDTSEINESVLSERIKEETAATLNPWGTEKLKYPNNTEGYGASITFTIMETKTFADVKGEENSSFSNMSKTFSEAKSAAIDSRNAKKRAKQKSKLAKELASRANEQSAKERESMRGAGGSARGGAYDRLSPSSNITRQWAADAGKEANRLKEESESLSEKAVALSRQGTSQLAAAISEAGSNAERTTDPREDVPRIQLYLPISFQQTDGFQIAGTDLGILGASVFAGTANTGSIIKGVAEGISSGFGSIIDLANNNVSGLTAATVVSRLATQFTPTEVANAFNIAAGVTVNPNTRSTFRGVNLREYTFQFKFLPKTRKEANDVEKIINLFRTFAYPETIEIGGVAAGYKFPDLFKIDIRVQMGEGKDTIVGNKLKHCYLRSISTNYNPTSMTFHTDGRPVEIDLSLSFQEETTLSRKDIEEGY